MAHIAVFSNMQEVKQAIEEHEQQVANHYVADDAQGKYFHNDGEFAFLAMPSRVLHFSLLVHDRQSRSATKTLQIKPTLKNLIVCLAWSYRRCGLRLMA